MAPDEKTETRYPFDPDNPVPKGITLAPKDLRSKYYKVIDPESKFFAGDPRLQRDRRRERDPKRTNHYKKIRCDPQEVWDDTHRYVIDEIYRGRWYGKEHAEETSTKVDVDKLMSSLRYSKDNDMFSIIANRYGRDPSKFKKVEKRDFITLNKRLAKDGGTYKNVSRSSSSLGFHAGYNGGMTQKSKASDRGNMGRSVSSLEGTYGEGQSNEIESTVDRSPPRAGAPPAPKPPAPPAWEGAVRPTTAYINSLPMPPADGEVPPIERRHKGIYPMDWRPSAKVQALKDRLQEILSSKHKHLAVSFRRFDEDHRGAIELAELYRVMVEESGIPCSRRELEELWDLFDRDRDGVVRYADYAKTMGNDALDERDFFQIAQRKAAGRYNEEVRYFDTQKDEESAHFMNAADGQESGIERRDRKAREKYIAQREIEGERGLFTLERNKYGALPHERRWLKVQTIPGTRAHELRLRLCQALQTVPRDELAAKCGERGLSIDHFYQLLRTLHVQYEDLPGLQLFATLDYDRDDLVTLDDLDRCMDFDSRLDEWDAQKSVPGIFSCAGKISRDKKDLPNTRDVKKPPTQHPARGPQSNSPSHAGGSVMGDNSPTKSGGGGWANESKQRLLRAAGRLEGGVAVMSDLAQRAATPLLRATEERKRVQAQEGGGGGGGRMQLERMQLEEGSDGEVEAWGLPVPIPVEQVRPRPSTGQKVLRPKGVAFGSRAQSLRPSTGSMGKRPGAAQTVSLVPGGGEGGVMPPPAPPKPVARPRTADIFSDMRAPSPGLPAHIATAKGKGGGRMRPLSAAGVVPVPMASGFIPQGWDAGPSPVQVWSNHD